MKMQAINNSRGVFFGFEALFAREYGYDVHHDIAGWYVVGPHEWHDEAGFGRDGESLGFDGRKHFADCIEAWALAYRRAKNLARRERARAA
jgi:hypothetical protein